LVDNKIGSVKITKLQRRRSNKMTKYVTIDHNNVQVKEDDDKKDIVIVKIVDSEIMLEMKRSMIRYQIIHSEPVESML
jgi:septum formation topological specificity factor MinE